MSPASSSDLILTEAQRRDLLTQVSKTLDAYVLPERAVAIQQDIQQRLADDGYSDITSAQQLAHTLTVQLQELSQDPQLRLYFSPDPLPDLAPRAQPTPAELAQEQHRSSLRNFDINRLERLGGNIGYLGLYGLEAPEFAGDTLAAAFTFLAHTDALVIDLRHNSGGSPAMVALLCSYLLPPYPATHLNDLYWRDEDRTQQWWTIPHLPAPRYLEKPVYLLVHAGTGSAAEELAYTLQQLKRATVVGEATQGSAHPGRGFRLGDHFWMFVPTGRTINPISGTNWNGTGVIPDVKVPAELAQSTAQLKAIDGLLGAAQDAALVRELQQVSALVQRKLNQQRQDLISRLTQPGS